VQVSIAGYFFFAGVILGLVCGFRINVRALRTVGAWQRKRRPNPLSDSMTSLLEKIKLRDTVGLEIAGFAVAVLMCMGAISFLNPDSDWHADALRAARHPWPWRR
jgi:hypothetical protein